MTHSLVFYRVHNAYFLLEVGLGEPVPLSGVLYTAFTLLIGSEGRVPPLPHFGPLVAPQAFTTR